MQGTLLSPRTAFVLDFIPGKWVLMDNLHVWSRGTEGKSCKTTGSRGISGGQGRLPESPTASLCPLFFSSAKGVSEKCLSFGFWLYLGCSLLAESGVLFPDPLPPGNAKAHLTKGDSQNKAFDHESPVPFCLLWTFCLFSCPFFFSSGTCLLLAPSFLIQQCLHSSCCLLGHSFSFFLCLINADVHTGLLSSIFTL